MDSNIPFNVMASNVPYSPLGDIKERNPRIQDLVVSLKEDPAVFMTRLNPDADAKREGEGAVQRVFSDLAGAQASSETALAALSNARAKDQYNKTAIDYYLEASRTVNDDRHTPVTQKYAVNQQILFEMLEDKFADTKPEGFWAKTGMFADELLRGMTIGWYEDVVNQNQVAGQEISIAASTMDPDEFEEFAESYVAKKAEEGFFTSGGYGRYMDAMFEATNSGYDPWGRLNQSIGIFGLGEAGAALRGSMRAGKVVSRAGAIEGSEVATDAAEAVLNTPLKDDPSVQVELAPASLQTPPIATTGKPDGLQVPSKPENEYTSGLQLPGLNYEKPDIQTPGQIRSGAPSELQTPRDDITVNGENLQVPGAEYQGPSIQTTKDYEPTPIQTPVRLPANRDDLQMPGDEEKPFVWPELQTPQGILGDTPSNISMPGRPVGEASIQGRPDVSGLPSSSLQRGPKAPYLLENPEFPPYILNNPTFPNPYVLRDPRFPDAYVLRNPKFPDPYVLKNPEFPNPYVLKDPKFPDKVKTEKTTLKKLPDEKIPDKPHVFSPAPIQGRLDAIYQENKLIQGIKHLYAKNAFGRMATEEQVNNLALDVSKRVAKMANRPVANYNITSDGLGAYQANVLIGKVGDGSPYFTKYNAEKAAASYSEKAGIPVGVVRDESGKFFIQYSERLDLTNEASALDINAGISNALDVVFNTLGSTRGVDDYVNNTLAQMAEGGNAAISTLVEPFLNEIRKVTNLKSRNAIAKVLTELRDGTDSHYRQWYSDLEFSTKFRNVHPDGLIPGEKETNAFHALKTISDASYLLQSDRIATQLRRSGYTHVVKVTGGAPQIIKRTRRQDVPDGAFILDVDTNMRIYKDDLTDKEVVYKLAEPMDEIRFITTKGRSVRPMDNADVLGYNAGGPRKYTDLQYFVTGSNRKVFLGAQTEKQANTAAAQINALVSNKSLTDEFVQANNDWNPNIETVAEWEDFLEKKGLGKELKVDVTPSGKQPEGTDLLMSMGDYASMLSSRSDNVIMSYGGVDALTENPIQTIADQFGTAASIYAFKTYNYRSKVAWLKLYNGGDIPNGSVQDLFDQAMNDLSKNVGGERYRHLKKTGDVIQRRDNVKDGISQTMEVFAQQMTESIFDKTGKFVNLKDLNVTGSLLNLGFRSAFGFWNLIQFPLQASHIAVAGAIAGTTGFRGAANVLPVRLLLNANKDGFEKGIPALSKSLGISPDETRELFEYIHTSGRMNIAADSIEKGTGMGWGVGSWEGRSLTSNSVRQALSSSSKLVKPLDEALLMPFTEGERLSRLSGIVTAYLEQRIKRPDVPALSEEGRMWITRREQDLSFNMTNTARGKWQSGIAKVPTQWLSYSMRAMENLTMGRTFTKAERTRMGMMYLFMSGTAGTFGAIGLGSLGDYVSDTLGIEPGSNTYVGYKYGVPDFILSHFFSEVTEGDIRTAFGSRLSPFGLFSDLRDKLTVDPTLTALGGPSAEIVGGAVGAMIGAVSNFVSNKPQSMNQDLARVARSITSVDNFVKAHQISRHGTFNSRTGHNFDSEFQFTEGEGVIKAMGIPNFREVEYYRVSTQYYKDFKKFNKYKKEFSNDYLTALRMINSGDETRGHALMNETKARIALLDMSEYDKYRMIKGIVDGHSSSFAYMLLSAAREENRHGLEVLESIKD